MLFLAIVLTVITCAHAQQIANVLAKNDGGMLQPLTEATFIPDRPINVPQDFISYAMGTDVRSTSLRPDRTTDVPQDFSSCAWGTQSSNSGISCSDNNDDLTKPKGNVKAMSIVADTDTCRTGFPDYVAEMESNFEYCQAYDTMRYWYIPKCYSIALASATAGALGSSAGCTSLASVDSNLSYRGFLIHCLTLRNDAEWFCAFVADLVGTYSDTNHLSIPDYRAQRGIIQYLINNPRCADDEGGNEQGYQQLLYTQYQIWVDTSTPGESFDSTVPTMQDLGLDSVLIINGQAGVTYAMPTPAIINSASVIENPFQNSTSILLSVGRESYITIAVYNVLGQQIAGAGYAGVFEQGSRTIPFRYDKCSAGNVSRSHLHQTTGNANSEINEGMKTLLFLLLLVPGSFLRPGTFQCSYERPSISAITTGCSMEWRSFLHRRRPLRTIGQISISPLRLLPFHFRNRFLLGLRAGMMILRRRKIRNHNQFYRAPTPVAMHSALCSFGSRTWKISARLTILCDGISCTVMRMPMLVKLGVLIKDHGALKSKHKLAEILSSTSYSMPSGFGAITNGSAMVCLYWV